MTAASRRLVPSLCAASAWFAATALSALPVFASTVVQLGLDQLCQRADKIFRGTVLRADPGTLEAGGGRLPTVTYRISVEESFKGDYETLKGIRVVEIRMLGKPDPVTGGNRRLVPVLGDLPALKVGETYLLLTTAASTAGLSTTVGLGQGCFHVTGKAGQEQALNGFRNVNLLPPPEAAAAARSSAGARSRSGGPIPYSELATQIRSLLAGR